MQQSSAGNIKACLPVDHYLFHKISKQFFQNSTKKNLYLQV